MATTVWSCVSGLSAVFAASGNLTSAPFCSSGATIIMMISSTSMTSTRGVTLMSDLIPPLDPPTSIDMVNLLLRRLLDEVVDHLRRRVVHLDVEEFELARQVVVEPHRRDGHEQAE